MARRSARLSTASKKNNELTNVFITVGTTEFDALIKKITIDEDFMSCLQSKGCKKLVIQIGRGSIAPDDKTIDCYNKYGIELNWYRFKPTLDEDFQKADLIISHAGAGTVIEVLKMKNKKLIICINDTLQGNHQCELADELKKQNYCDASTPLELNDILKDSSFQYREYPDPDYDAFPNLLDRTIW